jgi:hypothetical protein
VYAVQSIAYLEFVKGDLPSLPSSYVYLLPASSLDFSLPFTSLPYAFFPVPSPFKGRRGKKAYYTPGKK